MSKLFDKALTVAMFLFVILLIYSISNSGRTGNIIIILACVITSIIIMFVGFRKVLRKEAKVNWKLVSLIMLLLFIDMAITQYALVELDKTEQNPISRHVFTLPYGFLMFFCYVTVLIIATTAVYTNLIGYVLVMQVLIIISNIISIT